MPFTKKDAARIEMLKAEAEIEATERRQAMAKANNAVYDGATVACRVIGVSRIDVAKILERCARELRDVAEARGEVDSDLERDRR